MNETCKDCGQPIYQVTILGLWYHSNLNDIVTCPASEVESAEQMTGD